MGSCIYNVQHLRKEVGNKETWSCAGAYPEIFRGKGFEIFLYGWENLGGFWDFFIKNP